MLWSVGEESFGCGKQSLATGMTMRNCDVRKWTKSAHVKEGKITLAKCTFRVSISGSDGNSRGGVGRVNEMCELIVSECWFVGCSGIGPSCFDIGCRAEITNSNFTNNEGPVGKEFGFHSCVFESWKKGFGCLALMTLEYTTGEVWSANCVITNCRFENNQNGGVATARGSTVVLTSSLFENNAAEDGLGGDLMIDGGHVTLTSCNFSNDNACQGRSVYCAGTHIVEKYDNNLDFKVTNCCFLTNATEGSSIYFFFSCSEHSISMDDCWFYGDSLHFQWDNTSSSGPLSLKCTNVYMDTTKEIAVSPELSDLTGVSYKRTEPSEQTQEIDETSEAVAPTHEDDPGDESDKGGKNPGLSGGAVAAIVLVVLVIVAVLVVFLLLYIRKRRYMASAPNSVEETSEATTTATGADVVSGVYGSGFGIWDEEPN